MVAFICSIADTPSDKEFITWIYMEIGRLMQSTATKYITSHKAKEDIIQECFLRLIGKVTLLRTMPRQALAAYLVVSVRNTAINYCKTQQKEKRYRADIEDTNWLDKDLPQLSVEDILLLREKNLQLRAIWPKLTEEEQFLLEGKYILKLSDAELAQQIGCKASSVRMKLTRTRRRALFLLSEQETGG